MIRYKIKDADGGVTDFGFAPTEEALPTPKDGSTLHILEPDEDFYE